MAEIKYEIVQEICVLSESARGWTKELNLVSWNDREPKFAPGITRKALSLGFQLPSSDTSTGFTQGINCSYSIPTRSVPLYSAITLNGTSLSPAL